MFTEAKKPKYQQGALSQQNTIAQGTVFEGDLKSEGDFRIEGKIHGTLITKGKVVIGNTGKIEGSLSCKNADVEGYAVIGKTGTANKPKQGAYSSDAIITSFLAGFPGHAPRYVMLVMLDEPIGIEATYGQTGAGWNAAPTSGNIIKRIAPILGVLPNRDAARQEALLQTLGQTAMADSVSGGSYAP